MFRKTWESSPMGTLAPKEMSKPARAWAAPTQSTPVTTSAEYNLLLPIFIRTSDPGANVRRPTRVGGLGKARSMPGSEVEDPGPERGGRLRNRNRGHENRLL